MPKKTIKFIRELYGNKDFIPLHEPRFIGNEKNYVTECLDSTFVSSVGKFVDQFEDKLASFTGTKHAIATVNGTSALHIALLVAGVEKDDEVITQPLTFVATCNAIRYLGASPIFIDVDRDTMGLSPERLEQFLSENTQIIDGECINMGSKNRIKAVVPMHTFGHPVKLAQISEICVKYHITLVEDAAESLGSFYRGKHTGSFGSLGVFSFNGNKIITTGGGGMIITNDDFMAKKAKHITTTAKIPHQWDYRHDQIGYNYRLPNINAALGCAQMEMLSMFIEKKRALAATYKAFFLKSGIEFISEPEGSTSNYWLNGIVLEDKKMRDSFLEETNKKGIMTRPVWKLLNRLKPFENFQTGTLDNAEWLEDRVVNIPSSVRV